MGKLANLASVKSSNLDSFVYTPPDKAFGAFRILVNLNLGYAMGAPSAVNWGTVGAVLRGLRRATARGRILIVDKICPASASESIFDRVGLRESLDDEMRIAPVDALALDQFNNPASVVQHTHMIAPAYLNEFDCVISVSSFEHTPKETKGAVTHLYHWLPCDSPVHPAEGIYRHHDIYHTLGHFIDGAVLECRIKHDHLEVVWGNNLLALDTSACQKMNVPIPDYLPALKG